MSKSRKDEQLVELLNESGFGTQFLIYLEKRALNPQAVWKNMTDESLQAEFITKCQWVQHYARTKLGAINVNMGTAAGVVNSSNAGSFSREVSENIFDGFMHFVVANETNPKVLNSLMTTWVSQGRSLTELDSNKITPLQTAVYTKNITSFIALANHDVDITALDGDGLSPLHVIVNKIENGSASILLLKAWLEAGLPTDMVSGKAAKKWSGKTAVEFAEMKGLVEVTDLLGGDVELAILSLDELYNIQMNLITQSYDIKMASDIKTKAVVAKDPNKLLLHYLVDNRGEISLEVFAKFLADEDLGIKYNILFGGKTALQKCVELGYNDWTLELAKAGVGTDILDNGVNIVNYCVLYDNNDLLDMLDADSELDITTFALPERQYVVSEDTALPLTPLLQAVTEGKVDMVVKLAKAGFGTTSLDNTNHVLNYVSNLGGSKKIEITKALASAKIDVSHEKAEQALVSALHPKIDAEFVSVLVDEIGINTEGALELFATHKLLPQIECLVMNGAKITSKVEEILTTNGIKEKVDTYVEARIKIEDELESTKPMSANEKIQFILSQTVKEASVEEMIEAYPGSDGIGEQYINAFIQFKITQDKKPGVFEKLCKMYKVTIPVIEKFDISELLVVSQESNLNLEEDVIVDISGDDGTGND